MSDLLPCPFCGTAPQIIREADFVSVACSHYYCNFSQIALRNEEKAIARWNTRAPAVIDNWHRYAALEIVRQAVIDLGRYGHISGVTTEKMKSLFPDIEQEHHNGTNNLP